MAARSVPALRLPARNGNTRFKLALAQTAHLYEVRVAVDSQAERATPATAGNSNGVAYTDEE